MERGGYAKRLTIYTGSGPRLGRVITLRPVLGVSLFALYCFEYVLYRVVYRWYPQQPFIVQVLKRVVQILLGYKIRVLSYASVIFPCIVRVVFASYLLDDWAAGFVAKAHFPVVRSMGGP